MSSSASIEYWFWKSHFSVRSSNCNLDLVCSFSTLLDQSEQLNLGCWCIQWVKESIEQAWNTKSETELTRYECPLIDDLNCEIVICSSFAVGSMLLIGWVMMSLAISCWRLIFFEFGVQASFNLYYGWVRVEQCSMQVLSDQDRRRLKWRSMTRRFNLRLCWELLKSICRHSIRLNFDWTDTIVEITYFACFISSSASTLNFGVWWASVSSSSSDEMMTSNP